MVWETGHLLIVGEMVMRALKDLVQKTGQRALVGREALRGRHGLCTAISPVRATRFCGGTWVLPDELSQCRGKP